MAKPEDQGKKRQLPPGFVAAQFKPGQSGNPKGRPKGASLEELVSIELDRPTRGGNTKREMLAKKLCSELLKLRSDVLILVLKRIWPEVQSVHLSGTIDLSGSREALDRKLKELEEFHREQEGDSVTADVRVVVQ